jgi:tripartite-type tricarboxylate transporter receptor subunit TctC
MVRWLPFFVSAFLASAVGSQAQETTAYPERPIRLVVAFAAGGGSDTVARQVAEELRVALGQPVVVENRTGAGGNVAWNYVASAPADGYTLLLAENALPINAALHRRAPNVFDPVNQLDAIAGVATSPMVLVVGKAVKANSVAELAALSRSVPEKMNYASPGVGTLVHLAFEVLSESAGIEAVHVAYKGGAPAIRDVIAGHVPMTLATSAVAKRLIEQGQIRGLAVISERRSPVLPELPSLPEAGVKTPAMDLTLWYGIFGPKGMPEPVKAKIGNAVAGVLSKPEFRERLLKLDIIPEYLSSSKLSQKLENDIASWSKFIEARGIKAP